MELSILDKEREGGADNRIVDIPSLIENRTAKSPDVPADVILMTKVHESIFTYTEFKRHLFLNGVQGNVQGRDHIYNTRKIQFLRVAKDCIIVIPLNRQLLNMVK